MNKYILLLFCCMPVLTLADADFNELFETDLAAHIRIADRVATYHATDVTMEISDQQAELESLQQSIEIILQDSPAEPLYWFISGLNHNNLASLAALQNNKVETDRQVELRNLAYHQAMLLDQTLPLRLSASIYATMKHGLPPADKILAIKNEIQQGGSVENDTQYIHLHWSQINELEKSGRHDEAQLALKEMQREIRRLDLKNPDYQLIVDRAQESINRGRAAESRKETQQPESRISPAVTKPSIIYRKNTMWIIFFAALALISIWMIVRAFRSK